MRALLSTVRPNALERTTDGHYAVPLEVARIFARGLVCERVGPDEEKMVPRSARRRLTQHGRGAPTYVTTATRKRTAAAAAAADDGAHHRRSPDQFRYLFDLPLEMWSRVLSYLPPNDRAAFASTSHRAHEITSKPQVLGPVLAARLRKDTLMRVYLRLWREKRAALAESEGVRAARDNFLEALRFALPSIESRIAVSLLARGIAVDPHAAEADLTAAITAFTRYDPAAPRDARDLSWFLTPAAYDGGPTGAAVVYLMAAFALSPAADGADEYTPSWLGELALLLRTAPLETARSRSFWQTTAWAFDATVLNNHDPDVTTNVIVLDPLEKLKERGVTFTRDGTGACLASLGRTHLAPDYVATLLAAEAEIEWFGLCKHPMHKHPSTSALALAIEAAPRFFLQVVQSISLVPGRFVRALSAAPSTRPGAIGHGGNIFHYAIIVREDSYTFEDVITENEVTNYALLVDLCPADGLALLSARDANNYTPLLSITEWFSTLQQFEIVVESHRCREFAPLAVYTPPPPEHHDGTAPPLPRCALETLVEAGFERDADGARLDLVRRCLINAAITGAELDAPSVAPRLLFHLATLSPANADHQEAYVDLVKELVDLLPAPVHAEYANVRLEEIFRYFLFTGQYAWLRVSFLPRLGEEALDNDPRYSFARAVIAHHNRLYHTASDHVLRLLLLAVVRLEGASGARRGPNAPFEDKLRGQPLLTDDEWVSAGYSLTRR
jgi:hypothetical protein